MDTLAELLDTAARVPQRYRMPPLAEIRGRARRRRRARIAVLASTALVVVLVGGLGIAGAASVGPLARLPVGSRATVAVDPTALPWGAAMVSRDDRTITVHT